jgi:SAM-dependent methyltransferase
MSEKEVILRRSPVRKSAAQKMNGCDDQQWQDQGIARNIQVVFNDHRLKLHVDMNIGIGGDKWPAAELFCNLISSPRWATFFQGVFRGQRVVELGSGNGMVGILIARLFQPSQVTVTDLNEYVPLIRHNIEVNGTEHNCQAHSFDWFHPPNSEKFDIICGFEW